MNSFLMRAAGRAERPGVLDRLRGTAPLSDERQERLNTQLANHDAAVRRGDVIAAEVADHQIDKLLDEGRAERAEAAKQQEPPTTRFDGGVRRPVNRRPPPNMNGLIVRSVAERTALTAAARGD